MIPPFDRASPAYDGTVCLSKRIFLEGWLLPKLSEFNKQTQWVTAEAWCEEPDSPIQPPEWHLEGHVGINIDDVRKDASLMDASWRDGGYLIGFPDIRRYTYERNSRREMSGLVHGVMDGEKFPLSSAQHLNFGSVVGTTKNYVNIQEGFNADGKAIMQIGGKTEVYANVGSDTFPIREK